MNKTFLTSAPSIRALIMTIGSLLPLPSFSVDVPTGAGTAGGYILVSNVNHTTGTVTNTDDNTLNTVIFNGASNGSTLTVSGGIITSTDGKFAIATGADTTANLTVSGGQITNTTDGAVINTQHNLGTITVSSGSVTGLDAAIQLTGAGKTVSGISVSGTGLITSDNVTISIAEGVTLTNGITNSSNLGISGETGISNYGTLHSVTNSGSISAGDGAGIENFGTLTFGLHNSGTITHVAPSPNSGMGVYMRGNFGRIEDDAGIVNSGTITTTQGFAVAGSTNLIADIVNTGTISATENDGIAVFWGYGGSTLTGFVHNDGGTISSVNGTAFYNVGAITEGLTNSGTIENTGGGVAVLIAAGLGTAADNAGLYNTGIIRTGTGATIGLGGTHTTDIVNTGIIEATEISGRAIYYDSGTITGSLTNSGTIKVANGGTAISIGGFESKSARLTGSIINTGTITAGTTGTAIDAHWVNNTAADGLTLTNSGTIIGAIKGTTGKNDTFNFNGGTVTGNISMGGSDSDRINFGDDAGDSFTTEGTISAGILDIKFGTVNIGHIITLSGATKSLTVEEGATLNFTESQDDTISTITNKGKINLAAGTTITTESAVTINGGTLQFTVINDTHYGKLVGSGITLSNSGSMTIDAASAESGIAGKTLALFQGSTSIPVGITNNTILTDNSDVYKFTAQVDGYDVNALIGYQDSLSDLTSDTSLSANTENLITALDTVRAGIDPALDNLISKIYQMNSTAQKATAFQTLAPNVSGAVVQTSSLINHIGTEAVESHLDVAQHTASNTGVATGDKDKYSDAWANVLGNVSDQSDRNGIAGYQSQTGGVILGFDKAIADSSNLGIAYGYTRSYATSTHFKSQIEGHQFYVYGNYSSGHMYYEGVGSVALHYYDNNRALFDGSVASADFSGTQMGMKASTGYTFDIKGDMKLTPIASLQYSNIMLDDYTETGSNGNLDVENNTLNILNGGLGVTLSDIKTIGNIRYVPRLSAEWDYDFIADTIETTSTFSSGVGSQFTTKGARVNPHTFKMGAGIDIHAYDNITVYLDYDLEAREKFESHTGSMKAKITF